MTPPPRPIRTEPDDVPPTWPLLVVPFSVLFVLIVLFFLAGRT